MRGTMLVYEPGNDDAPIVEHLDAAPTLEQLKAHIPGWLEKVPGFSLDRHDGRWRKCVALCDEEGKLKGLPVNEQATIRWRIAQLRTKPQNMAPLNDVLVGPVVVLYGDREFMEAL